MRIKGHTITRTNKGSLYGTIKVKTDRGVVSVKWIWDEEYSWRLSRATQDVKSFCVAYLEKIVRCFA